MFSIWYWITQYNVRALKKLEFEASYLLMYMKSTQTLDKRIELKNHMELKIDAMRGNGMKTVSRGLAWCSSGKKGKTWKECLDSGDDSDNHDDEFENKMKRISAHTFTLCWAHSNKTVLWNGLKKREPTKKKKDSKADFPPQKEFKVKCPKLKLFENS